MLSRYSDRSSGLKSFDTCFYFGSNITGCEYDARNTRKLHRMFWGNRMASYWAASVSEPAQILRFMPLGRVAAQRNRVTRAGAESRRHSNLALGAAGPGTSFVKVANSKIQRNPARAKNQH